MACGLRGSASKVAGGGGEERGLVPLRALPGDFAVGGLETHGSVWVGDVGGRRGWEVEGGCKVVEGGVRRGVVYCGGVLGWWPGNGLIENRIYS